MFCGQAGIAALQGGKDVWARHPAANQLAHRFGGLDDQFGSAETDTRCLQGIQERRGVDAGNTAGVRICLGNAGDADAGS